MNDKERVQSSFNQQLFMKHIGAEIHHIENGFCEIHLPFSVNLTQQNGYFHAGTIGTIADTAGGYAAYSLMQTDESVLTVEYKLNLLRPAKGEVLIARSSVIKAGKTLTVCSSNVFVKINETETLCATALVTLIALKNYNSK